MLKTNFLAFKKKNSVRSNKLQYADRPNFIDEKYSSVCYIAHVKTVWTCGTYWLDYSSSNTLAKIWKFVHDSSPVSIFWNPSSPIIPVVLGYLVTLKFGARFLIFAHQTQNIMSLKKFRSTNCLQCCWHSLLWIQDTINGKSSVCSSTLRCVCDPFPYIADTHFFLLQVSWSPLSFFAWLCCSVFKFGSDSLLTVSIPIIPTPRPQSTSCFSVMIFAVSSFNLS